MRTKVVALAVVVVAGVGCGDDDPADDPTATTTPSTTSAAPSPMPSPSLEDLNELIGVPEAGVENDCWLLDHYLLLGGDRKLIASGEEVRVTGKLDKNVMTTCQQGTPFVVDSVEPVE